MFAPIGCHVNEKEKSRKNVKTEYIERGSLEQEAQGLGALLDKMEDNDHINWITQRSRCIVHSKNGRFRDTRVLKIRNTPNDPRMTLST